MDAGGVQKEFFMLLLRDILNPQFGMFQEDEESHFIWFNNEVPLLYTSHAIIQCICIMYCMCVAWRTTKETVNKAFFEVCLTVYTHSKMSCKCT